MTSHQLARKIADAAILANGQNGRQRDLIDDPPTQAVLQVLFDTSTWFVRLSEDPKLGTVEERLVCGS